jgi:hypothetical protein
MEEVQRRRRVIPNDYFFPNVYTSQKRGWTGSEFDMCI